MGHPTWQRWGLLAVIALLAIGLIAGTLISSANWIQKPFPGFFLHENLTVGPYFLPHWTGRIGGLKTLDRVMSVEGRRLHHPLDLYDVTSRQPAGTKFRYQLQRGAETIDVTLPSMIFTFHDWFLTFGIYLFTGIAFLAIGVTPYYSRSSSVASFPLCFMVTAVFVWFATTFDFMTSSVLPKEMRIFGFTLTPSAGIHLGLLLKHGRPIRQYRPMWLILIYGISLLLGCWYSVTFSGPVENWTIVFRTSYAYSCAGALSFLVLLWSALRGPLSDLERTRLRVVFVGALLGFLLPTLSTVLTSSFHLSIPYNLALIPTVFFPLSVAYALLKYSLFDLGNTLKVGLSRLTLTAFLLMIYALVVFTLSASVGIPDTGLVIPLLFSVLVVIVFNPLLRWIERIVDRYVYRQEYDPARLQKEVSLFLRSLAQSQELANGFLKLVTEQMHIKAAALFYRPLGGRDTIVASRDGNVSQADHLLETIASFWNEQTEVRYPGLSRDEVQSNPALRQKKKELVELFDQLKAELVIPVVFERTVRGVASFGAKRSGREYSVDDLRLLGTLTDQLALSLENGRLFEESVKAQEKYRALYDEAQLANNRLIESDRIKKQFVANICHELRTPVSTIIGYGEVLLDPDFAGDNRAILERLVNNGQELSQMMDNLLDFSRMEADKLFTQFEPVNVKEVLGALELMTQRLIRRRPIAFRIKLESPIDTIESDAKKLQQILVQLLTNALKFTQQGEIEVRYRTISDGTDEFVEISVSDTGIGIDQRDQEVIFEEFRQLDGSSTRHYGGTGLGLSLCKKLAQSLGGKISVSSELGAGSVFSLLLPVRPPESPLSINSPGL